MENGGKKNEEFLRETVTKRSAGKRRAKRAVLLAVAAVAFGLIACLTFVLARPALESRFGRWTEEEETISFPDEIETEPEETGDDAGPVERETQAPGDGDGSGEAAGETEPLIPRERIANANRLIVRVRADGTEGESGFAAGETETAGLLFSATSTTGFLLVDRGVTEGCTSYIVTLRSGTETPGTLRAEDAVTGLAVIGVDLDVLENAGMTELLPEVTGSGTMRPGDTVTTVGMPYGAVYSGGVGQIVYREAQVPAEDGADEILHTDLQLSDTAFLMSEDGALVGFSTRALQQSGNGDFYGTSALRPFLERLANGRQLARLGVIPAAVTEQDPGELPRGAVVDTVVFGSPAYECGIQAGDIISGIGGNDVYDMGSLQQALLSLTAGTETEVILYRQGRDGYTEQTFEVTVGAR